MSAETQVTVSTVKAVKTNKTSHFKRFWFNYMTKFKKKTFFKCLFFPSIKNSSDLKIFRIIIVIILAKLYKCRSSLSACFSSHTNMRLWPVKINNKKSYFVVFNCLFCSWLLFKPQTTSVFLNVERLNVTGCTQWSVFPSLFIGWPSCQSSVLSTNPGGISLSVSLYTQLL